MTMQTHFMTPSHRPVLHPAREIAEEREEPMARVLVVDDSAVDREIVGGLLKKAGDFEVTHAPDGAAALKSIEESLPDAIVTDLLMPNVDGYALVEAVKEEYPSVPVILMTGKGSEGVAVRALQHGAASYVPKACLAEDLIPTVQRVIAASHEDRTHTRLMHHMQGCELEFTLVNDLRLIHSAVSLFQQMLRCLPLGDEIERLRVMIAVEEALKNAYFHGNFEIGAEDPRPVREEYMRLAIERTYQSPYSDRRIHVTARVDREQAVFRVTDGGPGFDWKRLTATGALAEQDEAARRGVSLMRSIMDEVRYNDAGNEVTLVKRAIHPSGEDDGFDDEDDD
ncbi:MAG: response regulator [Planctomycetota bacterium]|nr:MAG: response regulator [Planctomycetota bacterium]REJ94297.1 MAG: response regulator [Planctomycetota bacterium]REK23174.1 MAG: response regulator [Planctomycetota bacterium]REK30908.1 MAG: response regulator [Planctomycetota bacterium]